MEKIGLRRGKKRAIHTFGEVTGISGGRLSRIEIGRLFSSERFLTIYSEKVPKKGFVWIVIVPFRRELLGQDKPFMIVKLKEMTVEGRKISVKFVSVDGKGGVEIVLDDRGRARNLRVGEDYIFDLMDRRSFFERYERGSIPAGTKYKRSEPDRLSAFRMRNFRELANNVEGQMVLDAATGVKDYLRHFSKKGCSIICANISTSILKRTRDEIGNKKAAFVAYDVKKGFSFRDESFDLVICDALLEYLSEPHKALNQIFDLIKDGGRLLLLGPARSLRKIRDFYPQDLWEVALWRPIFDPDFNESLVESTLEDMGFKIVEKRTMRFKYPIYDEEQFTQSIISLCKVPKS